MLVKSVEGERCSHLGHLLSIKLTIRRKVKCDDDQISKPYPRRSALDRGRLFSRWRYRMKQPLSSEIIVTIMSRLEKDSYWTVI